MKKFLSLVLSFLLCMVPFEGYAGEEENPIHILCLGSYLEPDVAPFYSDSRIMAPVRAVFEAVGAEVFWDEETKCAKGVKDDTEVCLTLGSNIITVNGEQQIMDTALIEKDGRVFAPIRFVAESFSYKVSFHEASNTAVISQVKEYEYYPDLGVCVPLFNSVTDSEFLKTQKSEENNDVYYYSYSEDYVTEYFNTLQSDFGYVLNNISFENGSHIYEYASENGHIIKVEDYHNDNGVLCIKLTPDPYRRFSESAEYPERDSTKETLPQIPYPPQTPTLPETPENPVPPEGSDTDNPLDYTKVTGSPLIDSFETEDGTIVYRYEYNQLAQMRYESFLSANGWYFYDFDFDLDTFTNTMYYTNGNDLLAVSTSHMFGAVMIIYPSE